MEIWTLIVQSNTFNFIIMAALLAFIVYKCKLGQKLDESISKVKETIDNSKAAKDNSVKELEQAGETTKNVLSEIEEIELKAQTNLSNLEEKIAKDNEKQIDSIQQTANKIIDAKEKEIVSNLSKKTILASIEVAKLHVINLLKQHPDYHQKFIKESIEELNRLK